MTSNCAAVAGPAGFTGGIEVTQSISVGRELLVVPMRDRLVVFNRPGT